jgi:hypothetical protein
LKCLTERKQEPIANYGEPYRQEETISTAFVESTINQVVSRRVRQTATDALDLARRSPTSADADQSPEQRIGGGVSSMVPAVPNSCSSRVTPGLLLLS